MIHIQNPIKQLKIRNSLCPWDTDYIHNKLHNNILYGITHKLKVSVYYLLLEKVLEYSILYEIEFTNYRISF